MKFLKRLCLGFLVCATPARAGYIIVSDLDDTIRLSRVADQNLGAWLEMGSNLLKNESFVGMAELYRALDEQAEIFYVTVAPTLVRPHIESFLGPNRFPPVKDPERILTRDWAWPGGFAKKFDHKVLKILEVIDAHPEDEVIFIMDNGEQDVSIADYLRDHPRVGNRIKYVFMHRLYHRPRGEKLKYDQTPFYTAADLAFLFYNLGLVSEEALAEVLKVCLECLRSFDPRLVERVYPNFAYDSWENVSAAFEAFKSTKLSFITQQILDAYLVAFESRVRAVNYHNCGRMFPRAEEIIP